ncbi:hypothetical protein GX50_01172 [[Emmonsia] crescens]|uniref:Uncharacterized protein n=1 Tax=[Emmonsia] crescens TaxID=73230 RepID=A0A2B7ZSM4_9EURO|nr:hypothetical protein GX50_01172 [Emmonsia crescens]
MESPSDERLPPSQSFPACDACHSRKKQSMRKLPGPKDLLHPPSEQEASAEEGHSPNREDKQRKPVEPGSCYYPTSA